MIEANFDLYFIIFILLRREYACFFALRIRSDGSATQNKYINEFEVSERE